MFESPTSSPRERLWTQVRKFLDRVRQWTGQPWVRRAIAGGLTLIVAASMGAILYANWDTLREFRWQINPVPLVLAFPLYALALALAILAWGQILSALGASAPWNQHIHVYVVTNLARRLPGILWYVIGRVALYTQDTAFMAAVSVGSALELVLIAMSGLSIGLVALPGLVSEHMHPAWIVGGLAVGMVIIHPRVIGMPLRWLRGRQRAVVEMELHYGQVFGWLLLYGGSWLAGGLVLFALIRSIYPIPMSQLPQIIGAWCLSGMVAVLAAVLPVGFGLRELTMGLLLSTFLPDGFAMVVAILSRLLLTFFDLTLALLAQWKYGAVSSLARKD